MPLTERCDGDSRDLAQRLVDVDFSFVPTDLSDRSRQLIESYHGVHAKLTETIPSAPTRRQAGVATCDRTSRAPLPADRLGS